jgi:hypothetical protein
VRVTTPVTEVLDSNHGHESATLIKVLNGSSSVHPGNNLDSMLRVSAKGYSCEINGKIWHDRFNSVDNVAKTNYTGKEGLFQNYTYTQIQFVTCSQSNSR